MVTEKGINVGVLGDSPEDRPTTHGGILNDPEMDGLTLYEKKALLINRELDSHGMGKYQVPCHHSAPSSIICNE